MKDFDYEKYCVVKVGLNPLERYTFIFEDGTGVFATPQEFHFYAVSRFDWNEDDSFEVYDDEGVAWEDCEFYILPPCPSDLVAGVEFNPSIHKETRFKVELPNILPPVRFFKEEIEAYETEKINQTPKSEYGEPLKRLDDIEDEF